MINLLFAFHVLLWTELSGLLACEHSISSTSIYAVLVAESDLWLVLIAVVMRILF